MLHEIAILAGMSQGPAVHLKAAPGVVFLFIFLWTLLITCVPLLHKTRQNK